ncbi:MAG: YkgJ family cysteine cluster protein [Desulfosalsimonadaceae bacterium]
MTSDAPVSGADIFECQNCGRCCCGFGGTYVTPQNIAEIADYLGLDSEQVRKDFCAPSGKKTVLAQKPDGYCVFWDEKCTIHPVKPRMCRAWPFIENVLRAPENWHIMADSCPGIKPGVSESTLVACVRHELARLDAHNAILP